MATATAPSGTCESLVSMTGQQKQQKLDIIHLTGKARCIGFDAGQILLWTDRSCLSFPECADATSIWPAPSLPPSTPQITELSLPIANHTLTPASHAGSLGTEPRS